MKARIAETFRALALWALTAWADHVRHRIALIDYSLCHFPYADPVRLTTERDIGARLLLRIEERRRDLIYGRPPCLRRPSPMKGVF
jgi:hypothetical protein